MPDCHKERMEMPKLHPEERVTSFEEVELGLTREEAIKEALRCLGCCVETCIGCKICAEVCPDACIHIDSRESGSGHRYAASYSIDGSKCMFCGLCVEACPTKTLYHTKEYELSTPAKEDMYYRMKIPGGKEGES
jgi:formate hydrogenlyase subunit 6/NADH:ubiquinone oxidoreductase subunit I